VGILRLIWWIIGTRWFQIIGAIVGAIVLWWITPPIRELLAMAFWAFLLGVPAAFVITAVFYWLGKMLGWELFLEPIYKGITLQVGTGEIAVIVDRRGNLRVRGHGRHFVLPGCEVRRFPTSIQELTSEYTVEKDNDHTKYLIRVLLQFHWPCRGADPDHLDLTRETILSIPTSQGSHPDSSIFGASLERIVRNAAEPLAGNQLSGQLQLRCTTELSRVQADEPEDPILMTRIRSPRVLIQEIRLVPPPPAAPAAAPAPVPAPAGGGAPAAAPAAPAPAAPAPAAPAGGGRAPRGRRARGGGRRGPPLGGPKP